MQMKPPTTDAPGTPETLEAFAPAPKKRLSAAAAAVLDILSAPGVAGVYADYITGKAYSSMFGGGKAPKVSTAGLAELLERGFVWREPTADSRTRRVWLSADGQAEAQARAQAVRGFVIAYVSGAVQSDAPIPAQTPEAALKAFLRARYGGKLGRLSVRATRGDTAAQTPGVYFTASRKLEGLREPLETVYTVTPAAK